MNFLRNFNKKLFYRIQMNNLDNFLIVVCVQKKFRMEFKGKYIFFNERYWQFYFYMFAYSVNEDFKESKNALKILVVFLHL